MFIFLQKINCVSFMLQTEHFIDDLIWISSTYSSADINKCKTKPIELTVVSPLPMRLSHLIDLI